ncbi:MAG: hypothetical protein P4L79_09680 [Legionella sp.]|uniref:hypothetical protein n=1 Tax=Legionella sp. TaxID=459 RepID=UPI00284BFEAF|nr:hypothetical protein [Legionella sp.]
MIKKWIFLITFALPFLFACTKSVINYSSCVPINLNEKIAVIPFVNNTETPLADARAMSITASVLESKGVCHLAIYQNRASGRVLFPGMNQVESRAALLKWARRIHARYAMTGNVNEWTYKVGLDGEPVVGIALQLIDLKTERVVWTAVGSSSRGSRIAVTTAAQDLINSLLSGLYQTNCMRGK